MHRYMVRTIGLTCIALAACGDGDTRRPPTVGEVAVTTMEDTPVAVVVPLTATNPSAVTLTVVTPPSHGTLTGRGPTWTYTPAANYNGPDSAVVKAEDTHGSSTAAVALTVTPVNGTANGGVDTSPPQSFTITVTPVNDAPVANPDSFATGFGTSITITQAMLLANDTDVDGTPLHVVSVDAMTDGHGTPTMSGGDVVFTPESLYQGSARFTYTISDGTLTAQATVTITVGADMPPSAVADNAMTDEDTQLTVADASLLANDTDPEHHTLTISTVGNAVHGAVSRSGTSVVFMPDANYFGPASFDYTISDGLLTSTATVTVTVTAVDDPPAAVDDTVTVAESALPNMLDVLANDTDIDGGPRTVATVTQPVHGSVSVATGGTAITYSSGIGYCNLIPNVAPDTFTYTLSPGGTTATVSVKVSCACGLNRTTDFVVGMNP